MARPNIVLIHSDQHRYDCVGANGNAVIRTPSLDALVASGVAFDHAFSTCPICTPARASLMTGAWPTTHGSLCIPSSDFYRPARRELPVLPRLMHDAGYFTGMVGKYHAELEGSPTDHGVEEFVPLGEYARYAAENDVPEVGWEGGLYGAVSRLQARQTPLAFQADRVLAMLDRRAPDERPFFVRWDPPEPHLPYRPVREFHDLYEGTSIPAWPSFPDPLEGKPAPQARQHTIWGTGGWSWEQWEPIVRLYYAQISELDHHVGRVLARIDELGIRDNTLVIYTTDHGDYAGGHGLFDKHFGMYDDVTRVPLIVRWPERGVAGGARSDGFVSQELDVARTIAEAAGCPVPQSFAGEDLVALARGTSSPRVDMFAQYFGTESGMYSSRMLRDERWKYVWNPLDTDELYDLAEDPGELRNLIDRPEAGERLAAMRKRLVEWMTEVGDRLCNLWTKVELLGAPNAYEQSLRNERPW